MENKKLLSVRLDPTTLANIEKFLEKHYYWKRNTVISCVLDAVFDNFDDESVYDMVRYDRDHDMHASGSFSLKKLAHLQPAAEESSK